MPKTAGSAATRLVKDNYPGTKIVILSVLDQDDKSLEALAAGADGYLLKDEKPQKMVQATKDAVEGRLAMSPLVAYKTLSHFRQQNDIRQLKQPSDYQLTDREIGILAYLAEESLRPPSAWKSSSQYQLSADILKGCIKSWGCALSRKRCSWHNNIGG